MKKPVVKKLNSAHLWTAMALLFVLYMVVYPRDIFDAAKLGLQAWWNIVLPALLPFFIGSELLMGFGLVHFMGVLLQPIMRPLFNLPGAASLVMAIGFSSGFPIGSMVTAKLRQENLVTRKEGERLLAFTNNASPLFMLSAVAVGMLKAPEIGVTIALAHYGANLAMGLLFRLFSSADHERGFEPSPKGNHLLLIAFRELSLAQQKDGRPLGKILSDAVTKSMNNLISIGGFVILFSVLIKIMDHLGIIQLIAHMLSLLLTPLNFHPDLFPAMAKGFFEITLGSNAVSETGAPLIQKAMAIGIILAWSGVSVHAQVISMVSGTDLRLVPFLICRIGQAILSIVLIWFLFHPSNPLLTWYTSPALQQLGSNINHPSWWLQLKFYTGLFLSGLLLVLTAGLLLALKKAIKIWAWRVKRTFK